MSDVDIVCLKVRQSGIRRQGALGAVFSSRGVGAGVGGGALKRREGGLRGRRSLGLVVSENVARGLGGPLVDAQGVESSGGRLSRKPGIRRRADRCRFGRTRRFRWDAVLSGFLAGGGAGGGKFPLFSAPGIFPPPQGLNLRERNKTRAFKGVRALSNRSGNRGKRWSGRRQGKRVGSVDGSFLGGWSVHLRKRARGGQNFER